MDEKGTMQGQLVTGNFTITATMPNGKSMNIAGYLYEGESVESVNARVSLFHDIVDHQRVKAEIPELEAKHDQMAKALSQMKDVLAELEGKQSQGVKLSSQERLTIKNMHVSVTKVTEDLAKGSVAIAEAKRKVA